MMGAHNMKTSRTPMRCRSQSRGVSLIIVLVMMVIIGITAATSMRSATSEQRVTNNIRMEATAQQYAEAALRFCEAQMRILPDTGRLAQFATATLQAAASNVVPVFPATHPSNWENPANWTATGVVTGRHTLVDADIGDNTTNKPAVKPQCLVEFQTRGAFAFTVVTARGFSPDYVANGDGTTKQGAVVWLQSIINAR